MEKFTYQGTIQYCNERYQYFTYLCNKWDEKEKAINELKIRKNELEKKGYKFCFATIEIEGQEIIKLD